MMKQLTTMMAILAAMTLAVPAVAAPLLQDGLISVWSFDEATGTTVAYDTGGTNSNDATFSSGMATTGSGFTSGGILNNYIQFYGYKDSDSIAQLNATSSLEVGDQMTFSTWVKIDQDPYMQQETWLGIFDAKADDYVMYVQSDSTIRMKLVTENGQYHRLNTDCTPILYNWAHVAVVYDGRENLMSRMYINGVETTSHWGLFGDLQAGQIPSFGGQYNPATDTDPESISGNFYGGIDETGLWNRALTPDEIAHLYNGGLGKSILAENPEGSGIAGESPLVTVSAGTPIIQYDFDGNLNNSGSLGASYNAVHQDGTAGTLTYETSVLNNNGINLNNGGDNDASTYDGDRLAIPFELSSLDAGTMTFWVKENANYYYNSIFNCPEDDNDWEMWIYGEDHDTNSGKYKARIDSTSANTVYTNPGTNENGNGLDEWNHFAFSWYRDTTDPTKVYMRMFLNGNLVNAATSTWTGSGSEFYLGGGLSTIENTYNDFGTWSMDDFRLYEGALDADSILEIATIAQDIPGDANRDGKVDGSDVTILANNWQAGVGAPDPNTVTWAMGDFNGDGMVDGSDVTILANNWQYGVTTAAATVPEPSTVILILSALAGLGLFLRRR